MLQVDNHVSLKLAVETISLEAGLFANTISVAKNLLPSIHSGLKKVFNFTNDLPEAEKLNTKQQSIVLKNIQNTSFTDLDKLEIHIPEGFSGDFLSAADTIDKSIAYINDAVDNTLKHYRIYLSVFLSNKDAKISLKDENAFLKTAANKREDINKLYSEFYIKDSYVNKNVYTKVVRRNADLKELFSRYNAITNKLQAIDLKNIKQQLDTVTDLLDTIIKQIEDNKIENISPEALTNLSNGAYEIAQQMETIAACYFRALGISIAVGNMTEKLDKRLTF